MLLNCRKMPVEDAAIAGTMTAINGLVQGGPRRQFKWNKKAAEHANALNRGNMEWQLEKNRELQREAREYDSPAAQMARYRAAGLNPHLIYGGGSASGGGAFPIDFGKAPGVNVQAPDASYPDIVQPMMSILSQRQRISESTANEALTRAKEELLRTNPMLNPSVASWVSTSMEEGARQAAMTARTWLAYKNQAWSTSPIAQKVEAEIAALWQKVGLNQADLKLKNEILEGKEFSNELLEIQTRWLKDGDMTPQHWYQALLLLLSKMAVR